MQFQPQQYVDRFFPGATYVQMLPTELAREPVRADVLLEARLAGKAFGAHFEVQTRADATMGRRLCTYNLLAEEQHHLPMLSTVIYLEKCATVSSPWQRLGPDEKPIHTFHFHVVRLWEEPVEEWLAAGQVGLMPFVPFLKGATIESLEPVAEALAQIPDPLHRSSSVYYMLSFAERVFTPAVVNSFLRRNPMLDTFLQESPLYEEILSKGREEGDLRTVREDINSILGYRFPHLKDEGAAHLTTIKDLDLLRQLVLQIAIVPDEASARAALGL